MVLRVKNGVDRVLGITGTLKEPGTVTFSFFWYRSTGSFDNTTCNKQIHHYDVLTLNHSSENKSP